MRLLTKEEATASLADYVDQAKNSPIVITRDNEPIAVLMLTEGVDLETVLLSINPKFREIIQRSRLRDRLEGRLSREAVRQMFG